MIGRPFSEAIAEGRNNECVSMLERVYRTGEPELLDDQEHSSEPASYWSYSCWAIFGTEDLPAGVMIQITDTTENVRFRKRAAEMNQALLISAMQQHELTQRAEELNRALEIATQAKTQFLASMSHEIRTPLNVIMGFSELLSVPNLSEQKRNNFGERIKRQADLLLRLIDEILDLSKVEAGRLEIERIEVALPELIADIQMVMRHLAEEKGLEFSLTADDLLPRTILCDPVRLKQILSNVIGNAIKFTAAGSVRVRIRVDQTEQKLHFIVADTGSGLTPDQASRIFQPFTQADSTTTRKFGGTGLGLDLARRLARALGGDTVLVKTEAGVGSVFEITVALEGASYRSSPRTSQKPNKDGDIRLDGLSILIADDGVDNQFLLSTYLTLAGAHVELANDGEEAVSMAMDGDYDIILMDIQMPNLDGYQATERLRKLGCKVPVVAITAHAMRSEIEKCFQVGCDAHLSKPVRSPALLDMVHRMIYDRPARPAQPDGLQDSAGIQP